MVGSGGRVDLRSDTVTRPTPGMRRAMVDAEVGDDVFEEDPTVNRLQERCAELTGLQASLFMPSGTMANEVAICVHTRPGDEVVLEESAHINDYEFAAMAVWAGVLPRTLPSDRGWVQLEEIRSVVRPQTGYRARTGLISLENTHNMKGGSIYPQAEVERIVQFSHAHGIPVHLDGARIFNAAISSGVPVRQLTEGVDSVMFSFSKGLGAPVGSILAGSRPFIDEARIVRKRMGGGMRQVGMMAAACLYALDHHVEALAQDHENAASLGEALARIEGVHVVPPQTNIVILELLQMSAPEFTRQLAEAGVLTVPVSDSRVRMVTHRNVDEEDIERAVETVRRILE